MMNRVLVIYASRHGSTAQVATKIAATLRGRAVVTDCLAADRVHLPIRDYGLVVIGGALYNGHWHAAARRLLRRHRADLGEVPVAVFALGPREDTTQAWRRSQAQLDRALRASPWLHPMSVAVFGGADPPGKQPARELRDWAAIELWAAQLADFVHRPAVGVFPSAAIGRKTASATGPTPVRAGGSDVVAG